MAYWKDTWRFSNSIEHEYKYAGHYGAKGEKRAKKKKLTPEQISKQNQKNREKKMRRLIKANFIPDDIWGCLKYPKGTRVTTKQLKRDLDKFIRGMRYDYEKQGQVFKFIYRMEIGKRGGAHIHILINRIRGEPGTDVLMRKRWQQGHVNFTPIYDAGGYKELAEYITKQPKEETAEQLSFLPEEEQKEYVKYSSSRNLIRPQPERKVYGRWTMRKILDEGPKPTKGYFIDKNSIVCGVNQYTGMSYLYYTEVRIRKGDDYNETG